ncbi:MAG TPA: YraN family protein [Chloroflexi bacterium]|nr:YraN family protein [Chloroflexota bacterium]
MARRTTGIQGEQLACEHLVARGYEIVDRNWRCARGEIDIVARDGACWAFVEVKTRRGRGAGLPEDAITPRKLARLVELAQIYQTEHALDSVSWRIDVVAIELGPQDAVRRLQLVPGIGLDALATTPDSHDIGPLRRPRGH